jgi:uncharacterized protein (TIGR02246 family)
MIQDRKEDQMDVAVADPIEAVKVVISAHEAAVRAADVDAVLCNGTEDAVVLVANAPLVVGREAVRALYTQMFAMAAWDYRHEVAGTSVEGDLVFVHGTAKGTMVPTGGQPVPFANNFILTFKRGPDARWRFWRVAFAPASA